MVIEVKTLNILGTSLWVDTFSSGLVWCYELIGDEDLGGVWLCREGTRCLYSKVPSEIGLA